MAFVTFDLSVTDRHLNEMVDRLDAGLSDPGTCNAVSLALREQTGIPRSFRIYFRGARLRAEKDGEWIELSDEVAGGSIGP